MVASKTVNEVKQFIVKCSGGNSSTSVLVAEQIFPLALLLYLKNV